MMNHEGPSGKAAPQAVIYCRVSDKKQKTEGHGLESQETRCREYAGYRGYEVIASFHDDFTGAAVQRPGVKALVAFLKKRPKPGTIVIIDDISRLARSVRTHLSLRDAIALAGGVLESPNTIFSDDADSEVQEMIQAVFSGYHRRKNAEQVKNRMRARTMNGYWCFWPPVGYRFEKREGHGKIMCRNEPYASLVQEALEGYASGRFQTPTEVAQFLAAQPTWKKGPRPRLSQRHTKELLSNLLYAGYIDLPDWGLRMVPAKHEALISLETHETILQRLKGKAYAPARKNLGENFALRGFVCCASCGKPYHSCCSKGRSKSYPYYLCATKGCPDYGKSIRRDDLENAFGELVATLRPTHTLYEYARQSFQRHWDHSAERARANAAAIKAELAEIEHGVAQLVDRIVEAKLPVVIAAYEEKIGELERRRAILREQMASAGQPTHDFSTVFRTAFDFLSNPQKLWVSGRFDLRRLVLKLAFADRIQYARNGGFRTAVTALPFTILSTVKEAVGGLVGPAGLEPAT